MNHLGDTNKMVGEDHIRDATKMVSDTPRTDEAWMYDSDNIKTVGVDFAIQLERELNFAQNRIKRLEEAGDKMFPWSERVGQEFWTKAKEAKP